MQPMSSKHSEHLLRIYIVIGQLEWIQWQMNQIQIHIKTFLKQSNQDIHQQLIHQTRIHVVEVLHKMLFFQCTVCILFFSLVTTE